MKKLFTIIATIIVSITVANAQPQFSVFGGFTSLKSNIDLNDIGKSVNNINQFYVGVAYNIPLLIGFVFQPDLAYYGQFKAPEGQEKSPGSIELGLGLQWGIDMVIIRPFIFGKPFAGVAFNSFASSENYTALENAKNNIKYGFSFGVGTDLFDRVQVALEFCRTFGNLFNNQEGYFKDFGNFNSYNGVKITFGVLF